MSYSDIVQMISNHLLMTLSGWIVSLVVGGSLGYVCALVVKGINKQVPTLHHVLVLLPWRTLIIISVPVLIFTRFIVVNSELGMGWETGVVVIGLSLSLLTLAWTAAICIQHWNTSPPLRIRLIAMARSTVIMSISLGMITQLSGGVSSLSLLFYTETTGSERMIAHLMGLVFGMSFVIDLLLGIPHMVIARRVGTSSRPK